jgi:hypothetical protein
LLLEHNGFLSEDLTNFPNGFRDSLYCTFAASDLDTDKDFFTTWDVEESPGLQWMDLKSINARIQK